MGIHAADLNRLREWGEELGWELISADPPILAKAGREIRLRTNSGGLINNMEWVGGDEHNAPTGPMTSMNRIRTWMETEWDTDPPPDDDLP
jgi:hypothetical protein